ncbi:hypothetical protein K439DRAFT_1642937 [Ramaria rubella]|nr:hypothetical protein K439DRAFT_1642937 [Ramaria rubella]
MVFAAFCIFWHSSHLHPSSFRVVASSTSYLLAPCLLIRLCDIPSLVGMHCSAAARPMGGILHLQRFRYSQRSRVLERKQRIPAYAME